MTNTPELDADGNPIAQGGETVVLSKDEYEQLVKATAEKSQAVENMTGELQELRKKHAALKEGKLPTPTEVAEVVQNELAKRETEEIKSTYQSVSEAFLASHPEFSSENDPGGVKFKAFQKSLTRFNLGVLKTTKEFEQAFTDALDLTAINDPMNLPNTPAPRSFSSAPVVSGASQLSPAEQKIIKEHFGGDLAKFNAAKAKRPVYMEEILKWAR